MLKHVIKSALASVPGWKLYSAMRNNGVCVLTYHRINPRGSIFPGLSVDVFREQMHWLRRQCRPVTPDEAVHAIGQPTNGPIPVLVTFDDGYRDYHDLAFPILDELKIPSLVFVPTSFIGYQSLIWTDQLVAGVELTTRAEVSPSWCGSASFNLSEPSSRAAFVATAKNYLKGLNDQERRARLAELLDTIAVPNPEKLMERQMMTWDEVKATMPLTTYGGHSHEHCILSKMEPDALQADIATCKYLLDTHTGKASRYFAYPNGRAVDFDGATKECLMRNGFSAAFTTISGVNRAGADMMALRRQPTTGRSVGDFAGLIAQLGH